MRLRTCHYIYEVGQVVHLKAQNMDLEIIALGTAHDYNVPIYFVRPPGGFGAVWGMHEHEIETHD
jgi:hypothetical protein